MAESFAGKVVLVTGASSGIGRTTAIAFAREGAKVVVAARRVRQSEETVEQIRGFGGDAFFVQTDVSKSSQVQQLVARTIEHYGALHIAVNNAGHDPEKFTPIANYDEAMWDRIIATNLTGLFLCMKYELPHIVETKGTIVNVASVAGLAGGPTASRGWRSRLRWWCDRAHVADRWRAADHVGQGAKGGGDLTLALARKQERRVQRGSRSRPPRRPQCRRPPPT